MIINRILSVNMPTFKFVWLLLCVYGCAASLHQYTYIHTWQTRNMKVFTTATDIPAAPPTRLFFSYDSMESIVNINARFSAKEFSGILLKDSRGWAAFIIAVVAVEEGLGYWWLIIFFPTKYDKSIWKWKRFLNEWKELQHHFAWFPISFPNDLWRLKRRDDF